MNNQQKLCTLLTIVFKHKATDIHFNYTNGNLIIEVRGISRFINISNPIFDIDFFNFIQYTANLDLADQNKPQTSSFSFLYFDKTIHMRFALIKSNQQINGVLRILYQKAINNNLTIYKEQHRDFKDILKLKSGLIILSGPTGSGKTTTAYNLLLKFVPKRIYTIEDPIEMKLTDIIQLQVNNRQNLDYENGIKQLMRHDPDVLFIGEIRDEKEAQMAIRSALTGHLVLTTIHAKSCVGVIARLKDLNINMFDFYESISYIINQRLVSKLYQKERLAIYEIMDTKAIAFYHQHKALPDSFKTLSFYFEKAKQDKLISSKTEI